MKHIMDSAIAKFFDPTIPAWGKSEEEIDKPWWPIAEEGCDPALPGGGLARHDIEAGYISAVFVKDLSRLGRNYIEVGKLTEEFFPQHDIRLVAVADGVDSDEGEDDFTLFRNIMKNIPHS